MSLTRISIAALLTAVSYAAQTDDVVELTARAIRLQQAGDYENAAMAYRALLKQRPREVAAHVNLGVVLAGLGKYDEAIAEYQAAAVFDPGDPRITLNEALAYRKSGRLDEATTRFAGLHAASPQDKKVTMLLADCFLEAGDDQRVIDLLSPLAKADTNDLAIAYMFGTALMRRERLAEAQVYLDRILGRGDSAEGHFLLATRMFESRDYPAAIREFSTAAKLDPNLPSVHSFRGQALLATGDPDGASVAFHMQLAQNENDFTSNLELGQILTVRKRYNDALPLLEKAYRLRPPSPEAALALGEALNGSGNPGKARQYLESAAQVLPGSIQAHEALLTAYERLNLRQAARSERLIVENLQRAAAAAEPGPRVNGFAPEFTLPNAASGEPVSLVDLRRAHGSILVFGSYSCPNFRAAAEPLRLLRQRYGARIPFLLVYIREAHATGDWQSTRNERESVQLAPASALPQKQELAVMCSRKLHLTFPAVADGMDGAVESSYNAWPSRLFAVSRDGKILYTSRLTELDFDPQKLERVIREMIQ